jgi:predicted peptidase
MKNLLLLSAGALLLAACSTTQSQTMPKTSQTPLVFQKKVNATLQANYLLYLPADYSPKAKKRWPMILFLHGAGERGTNLWKVAVHGPPKIVKDNPAFPFIVSPQCPAGESWDSEVLLNLLDEVTTKYAVDTNRVYLTGLSMGGYGTWKLGLTHPERFAAIAPICGGGEIINVLLASKRKADALKTLGVWAFHGGQDPVVPVEESERMVSTLKKVGCHDVQLTIYPEAKHDSWTQTYENPAFFQWLLEHSRAR